MFDWQFVCVEHTSLRYVKGSLSKHKGWFKKMVNFLIGSGWLNGDKVYKIDKNRNYGDHCSPNHSQMLQFLLNFKTDKSL